jgi:hypothetical protein
VRHLVEHQHSGNGRAEQDDLAGDAARSDEQRDQRIATRRHSGEDDGSGEYRLTQPAAVLARQTDRGEARRGRHANRRDRSHQDRQR